MFTLKVFDPGGAYFALACDTFKVIPETADCVKTIEAAGHTILFDGAVSKVIVENERGQTIDVIRPMTGGR